MISLSRLRSALDSKPQDELELRLLRDGLTALWEQVTFRLWARRVGHVEELRPLTDISATVRLELWPLETLTKVEARGPSESAWTELVASDYVQEQPNVLRRLSSCWEPFLRVTYTGGYADDAAPADILAALVLQARFQGARHSADKIAARGASVQGGGVSFLESAYLHPTVKALATRYRRHV